MSVISSFAGSANLRIPAPSAIVASVAIIASAASAGAVTKDLNISGPFDSDMSILLADTDHETMFLKDPLGTSSVWQGLVNEADTLSGKMDTQVWLGEASKWSQAIQEAREYRAAVDQATADAVDLSPADAEGTRYITFTPEGIDYKGNDLSFTHVSGPVGIMKERTPTGIQKYVFATTGIEPGEAQFKQVEQDPRGMTPVGTTGQIDDIPGVKYSENARSAVKFTSDRELKEMQIGVGYDMLPDRDIEFELIAPTGEKLTIDANQFQVVAERASLINQGNEVGDYLAFVIKEDSEVLQAIQANIEAGGEFNIIGQSGQGRVNIANLDFGDRFKAHLDNGFDELRSASFHFSMSEEFQRRVAYNVNGPEITDPGAKACIFLSLTEEQKKSATIVAGQITDGTATYPRNWEAHVALDENGTPIALGSPAMWGSNLDSGRTVISGSATTAFTTSGGTIQSGCTPDYTTTLLPPTYTAPPSILIPGTPLVGFPGLPGTPGVPGLPGIPNDPDNPGDPIAPVPLPAPFWLLGAAVVGLRALAARREKTDPSVLRELTMIDTNKEYVLKPGVDTAEIISLNKHRKTAPTNGGAALPVPTQDVA